MGDKSDVMRQPVLRSRVLDNAKRSVGVNCALAARRMAGLGLLALLVSACGKGRGNDIDLGTDTDGSTTTQLSTTTSKGTATGKSTSTPKGDATSTGATGATTPGITTSFDTGLLTLTMTGPGNTGGSGTQTSPKGKRDCSKIKWGKRLKEGAIISRGDVTGYMDTDGDGLVEEKLRDVGMCQLHLSGKRCGLVVYGRWG